jgi:hypothetical protein
MSHWIFPRGTYRWLLVLISLGGCYTLKVDTLEEWCDQISDVDLEAKYSPFWAGLFAVQFLQDSVADDFTRRIDSLYVAKTEGRADHMAWREGSWGQPGSSKLHLVNLASLFAIEPEEFVNEWRGVVRTGDTADYRTGAETCFERSVVGLFDSILVHYETYDLAGGLASDSTVGLSTGREARLEEYCEHFPRDKRCEFLRSRKR